MLHPLNSPPRAKPIGKSRPKPSLTLNIQHINSTPPPPVTPLRSRPSGWEHTCYIDQVAMLRNPYTAPLLLHFQATGRSTGKAVGMRGAKQTPVQLRPDVAAPVSAKGGGYVSEQEKMVQKVNASGEFVMASKRALLKMAETNESSGENAVTKGDDGALEKGKSKAAC